MCVNIFSSSPKIKVKVKVQVYSMISMHVQPALFLPRHDVTTRAQLVLLVQPLDRAPGTYRCWVDSGSVDSKLAQAFAHMTGAAPLSEPRWRY